VKTPDTQAGSVIVEFALLLTPLLILAFGITEFGRAMYQYNAIAKSVRDSARYLSQYAPGDDLRKNEARALVLCGKLACGPDDKSLVPGLTTSHVSISDRLSNANYNQQSTGRGTLNLVRVEVSGFSFKSMAPAFVPNVTFAPIHVTMMQVL
jgi:Flp pilus assembly protein TadG